jgi:phospholipase/carboxylesterase
VPGGIETQLATFGGWTLRLRPARAPIPRLLLLLHGWTGDENSMWIFTRGLSSSYWMIAPRAPHPAESGGYSWRPAEPGSFGRPSLEALRPAADGLIRLVDAYAASVPLDAATFDLLGFSQGAAMVNLIALLYPGRVRRMGVLAGFVPSGLEARIEEKPLAGKEVFVAHGSEDPLVPVERARASIGLLERAGARIHYCEDGVGHKVSAACLRALDAYMKD